MKKISESGTNLPSSQIRSINIVKMVILPKAICRLNAIPIEFWIKCTINIEKAIYVSWGNTKKTRKVKTIISYKRTVGGITIPISKLYYRIIAIK